jgi:cold shock CspA family protein
MTGRIEVLDTEDTPGFIRSEDGVVVHFHVSDVAVRYAGDLAVGQLVTFDLERGNPPRAFNVKIEKQHYTTHGAEKRQQPVRYLGFDQTGNIRAYKFERLSPGGERQTATVSTDLALFLTHNVGLQDGPALCLRLVTAELDAADSDSQLPFQRLLTDADMLAHLASRPVAEKRSRSVRANLANAGAAKHVWRGSGQRGSS